MILKTSNLVLILSITWVNYIHGAPYSNVYVQSGPEVLPVEYIQYGSPSFPIAGGQYAQLSAAPAGSVVPLSSVSSYVSPCGSSCFYPGQGVAPISQFASAPANLVAYNSPISSVPVVVPREDTGYQYSYVVYDQHTGDHKAQREHSDGSVVRGEYSFIQPDGYVREVQYVADDLNGFNAIVKNYLPATVEEVKIIEHLEKPLPEPCNEVKNEPFLEEQEIIEHGTHEAVIVLTNGGHHSGITHHESEHNEHLDEPHHEKNTHHNEIEEIEIHQSHTSESEHGHPEESHHEVAHHAHPEESHHGHMEETQHDHSKETHNIEVVEIVNCAGAHHSHPEESHNAHLEQSHHVHLEEKESESSEGEGETHHEHSELHQEHEEGAEHGHSEHHTEGESHHDEGAGHSETHHEHVEETHHSSTEEEAHHGHSEDHDEPEARAHHGLTEVILVDGESHPEHTETAHHAEHGESHSQVSYDEVIRCAQTAVDEANDASAHKTDKSSSTYIIVNKPC